MPGKVCVITGATSGVGKETARALAQNGISIAIVGRDEVKGGETLLELEKVAPPGTRSYFFRADLGHLDQVRAAAAEIGERFQTIDCLINNAGVLNTRRRLSADGFELTFAVNHLAHFCLTGLLLNNLKAAPQARIINVSSDAHERARLNLDDLQSERRYNGFAAYGRSKLANLYFTLELARRLEGTNITANAVHPGFVATNFGRNNGWLARLAMAASKPFSIPPQKGAETSVFLATAPECAGVSGRYFYQGRQQQPAEIAKDPDIARRLWDLSDVMTDYPYRSSLLPPSIVAPITMRDQDGELSITRSSSGSPT